MGGAEATDALLTPEIYNCNLFIGLPASPAIRDLIDHGLTTNEATLPAVILHGRLSWLFLLRMSMVEIMRVFSRTQSLSMNQDIRQYH